MPDLKEKWPTNLDNVIKTWAGCPKPEDFEDHLENFFYNFLRSLIEEGHGTESINIFAERERYADLYADWYDKLDNTPREPLI